MVQAGNPFSFLTLLPLAVTVVLLSEQVSCLSCYKCSHNVLTDRNNLGSFYEWFKSVAHDDSCLLTQDGDREAITEKTCPEEEGKVAKCLVVEGNIEATFSLLDTIKIKYRTITRDCILVDEEDTDYSDGCHLNFPKGGPVMPVLESMLQNHHFVGDIDFTGTVCYSPQSMYVTTSGARRAALGATTLLLTMAWWLKYILLER